MVHNAERDLDPHRNYLEIGACCLDSYTNCRTSARTPAEFLENRSKELNVAIDVLDVRESDLNLVSIREIVTTYEK